MRILGAILAGGRSERFGSDKANALYQGRRLIDHVEAGLAEQCDQVVICGREAPGTVCLPDQPSADLGPIGGLNAALLFAQEREFTHVLSAPCDTPFLPRDLLDQLLGEGPAIASSQPVLSLWPASIAPDLAHFIGAGGRALYHFAETIKARRVEVHPPLININRPQDLPPTPR